VKHSLIVVFLLLLGGCAASTPIPPGTVFLSAQDHARFEQAAAEGEVMRERISIMEESLKMLQASLHKVEARTGLAAYTPKRLVPMAGGPQPASLGDVTWIARRGDRPKKRSLAKVVRSSRAVIFTFWATWCVPCISDEELAHLRELKRQLARHDVTVIPMAIDDLDKVLTHSKASQWVYPLWFHKGGHIEILPQRFIEKSGMGLPLFAVVAPDGRIHYTYQRKLDDELVEELVDASLSLPTTE
jgi:thiol-disulfide isomerase/thioredoxin